MSDGKDWELIGNLERNDLQREYKRGDGEQKNKWWREILPPHVWRFLKEKGYAGKVVRLPMFPTKNYPEEMVREFYLYRLAGRKVYVPKYYRSFDEDWVVCARILRRIGKSVKEIAEILDKSINTIRKGLGEE